MPNLNITGIIATINDGEAEILKGGSTLFLLDRYVTNGTGTNYGQYKKLDNNPTLGNPSNITGTFSTGGNPSNAYPTNA
jgi:hypothetical protein